MTVEPRTDGGLTKASVALLLEHRRYPGCTMASLTIRERLEVIEKVVAEEARAAALREVAEKREDIARAIHNERGAACDHRDELVRRWECRILADAVLAILTEATGASE